MINYKDCQLTVTQNKKVKYKVDLSPEIESDLCDDKLTKLTIQRLNRFVGANTGFCQQEDLRLLGMHLYHILFGGRVKMPGYKTLGDIFAEMYACFEKEFEERRQHSDLEKPDYRLRVTLIFEEGMEEIAGYPWEFLYVPRPNETGFFVAGENTGLILTRFVPSVINLIQPIKDELVILIAWAQPKELGPVAESDTVVVLEQLANRIEKDLEGQKQNIKVIPLPNATHRTLMDTIEKEKPQIVHFIGHGRTGHGRTADKAEIALMKSQEDLNREKMKMISERREPDEAHWVDSDSVRALFVRDAPPRLVFLHACNSAKAPQSLEIFKSTAQQVLHAGVPFVVAMQYEISNEDATDFAKTFYKKLGEGLSIDEAVYAGRIELGTKEPSWGHPRFGTPVIYFQSLQREASIIVVKRNLQGDVTTPSESKVESTGSHKCPYLDCTHIVSPDQIRCDCFKSLKLKLCPKCKKANREEETVCKWCDEYSFVQTPTPKQDIVAFSQPAQADALARRSDASARRP